MERRSLIDRILRPKKVTGLHALVLWGIIVSFVLWGAAVGLGSGGLFEAFGVGGDPNAAIEIDGQVVTRLDFMRQLRTTEDNYRRTFGDRADEFLAQIDLRQNVKNTLVQRMVALREADRSGLSVGDDEVTRYIVDTFVDEDGTFVGRERVSLIARRLNYTEEAFRAALAEDLLYQKLQDVVHTTVVVTDDEVRDDYLRLNDRAKIDYVFLDAREQDSDEEVETDTLRAFLAAHPERFEVQERKARWVAFRAAEFNAAVTVDPAEIRAEYDAREREFGEQRRARHILLKVASDAADDVIAATEERAETLLEEARAGADFAELARLHSEDEGSAPDGGDLGIFGRGRMVPPFEEAVFSLEPGELSDLVRTNYGIHIIELQAIEPARSVADASDELRTTITERKAIQLAQQAATAALDEHAASSDLAALAAASGREVHESGFLRQDGAAATISGIEDLQVPFVTRTLFGLATGGDIATTPIRVGDGALVLQLAEERGPIVPEFDEIRDRVVAEQRLERGRARVAERAAEIQAKLSDGITLSEATGVDVQSSAPFARSGQVPGIPASDVLAAAAWGADLDTVAPPVELEGGTVFFRLTERFEWDDVAFAAEADGIHSRLEQQRRGETWRAMLDAALADLTAQQKVRILAPDLFQGDVADLRL